MSTERDQIVNLTKQMVEIPSITGRTEESLRVLDLASKYLDNQNITSKTFNSNGIVSRIWGDKNTLMNPKLLLSGHIDVVDAPTNQFVPKIDSGKIYGRGSGDMKGHVASMLAAYKKYLEETNSSKGISILLTSDEEVGGFNGARYVVEKWNLRPSLVFIPDGEYDFNLVDSQKAPHHFHVRAVSEAGGGHVSKAFMIDNPVNKILNVYTEMRKKYSLATPEDDWKSTFEMSVIISGNGQKEKTTNSANQIAEWAEAWFAWRWPLEVEIDGKKATYKSGLKDLRSLAKKHGITILKDGHGFGEGCYTNPEANFVSDWKKIIEPVVERKVKFQHMHGATDGRHFYKYGSDVLVTSATTSGAHSDHENVDIDSLVKLSNAIYKYQKVMTE